VVAGLKAGWVGVIIRCRQEWPTRYGFDPRTRIVRPDSGAYGNRNENWIASARDGGHDSKILNPTSCASGSPEVGDDGEHPPVVVRGRDKSQLVEDVADVRLEGLRAQEQAVDRPATGRRSEGD